MNRRYVAILALIAAAILIGGSLLRPPKKPRRTEKAAPTPTPTPSRSQMRQISDFIADRAAGGATHLVYLPESNTSGVIWPDGRIVTTAPGSAIVEAREERPAAAPVILAPEDRYEQGGWIVAVAQSAGNRPVSASALLGGAADTKCGSEPARRLISNMPQDPAFAGAGVFDLSGDLLGMVVRCNDSWTALTAASVQRLLNRQTGPEEETWRKIGLRARQPEPAERTILKIRPNADGLFVTEVRRGSRAFQIGIRPGDLLSNALDTGADTITLVRDGRSLTLDTNPQFAIEPAPAAPVLTAVQEGTRLHKAGLRVGDRIVRVSGIEDPGPTDLNRLLASDKPTWLVYERENRRVWALLP